ncbi:MAG: D-Ala-D-Ala carboxypeptidase family metallohydrolase [Litorimonas sp.]
MSTGYNLRALWGVQNSLTITNSASQKTIAAPYVSEDGLITHDNLNWMWPNFTPMEMACRHCGQIYHWPEFMDRLQQVREDVGRSIHILSAHRCALHNARIGGAPLSQHLRLAADISLHGHKRQTLMTACKTAGFTGFGYYQTFLHIDLGRARHWYGGQKAKSLWQTP